MNIEQLQSYLANQNVRALLDTIAYGEGANYDTLYGGGHFSGNTHPCRKIKAGAYTSDAAGRYQFLCSTWRGLVNQYGFADFSPGNQDLAAVALIAQAGGITPILNGDLYSAIQQVKRIWPSLPGGSQQTRTWSQASNYYARAGGSSVTTAGPAATVAVTSPPITPIISSVDDTSGNQDSGSQDNSVVSVDVGSDYLGEMPSDNSMVWLLAAGGLALYLLLR